MTETIDQLIQARFDAVANPARDGDWSDVLARARNSGRRRAPGRIAVAAAVVVVAATVTAVAFGWPGTVRRLLQGAAGAAERQAFFARHNAAVPTG